jgi:hypothetical protein
VTIGYTARVNWTLAFTVKGERHLPMRGASAIAAATGALFVVEDDEGIYRVGKKDAALWAGRDLHPALGDLEGLAVNEEQTMLWALSERDGTVVAISLRSRSPRPETIGRLPRPGTKKNKGFEGLAFLPARLSPSRRASLVAVHEGKPRRVVVVALPGLEPTHELKLPDEAKELLKDLADVTIDPVTGQLLLLSDESQRIVLARIAGEKLVVSGSYDLPLQPKEKPEGLDFASGSRLLVVTDDAAKLVEIAVSRPARQSTPSRTMKK